MPEQPQIRRGPEEVLAILRELDDEHSGLCAEERAARYAKAANLISRARKKQRKASEADPGHPAGFNRDSTRAWGRLTRRGRGSKRLLGDGSGG